MEVEQDKLASPMAVGDAERGSALDYEVSEASKAMRERQQRAVQELLMRRLSGAIKTEGSRALQEARVEITKYSLVKAALRLHRARRKRDDPDEDLDAERDYALNHAGSLSIDFSENGDDRPLTGCSISPDVKMLATWGHTDRATDVVFSPLGNCLATASADHTARLWNADGSYLRSFKGHDKQLARIAFHPSGKYLGTTSYDETWRLWDVETGEELLLQEGHSRNVYGLSFHVDGSLAASCGFDSLARVWDLRSGKSVLTLEGHVKPVHGISFSPTGYHLAKGGEDNTCRIWDLRKRKSLCTIPAHSNLIFQVKFEPQDGYFLVTASHDKTAKVWSSRDFSHVKTLSDHESIIKSLDVAADGQYIATVSHDKTIKIFSSRNNEKAAMDVDC